MTVKKHEGIERNENLAGYVFLFPILLGFTIFMAFPLIFSLILSFSRWDFAQGISAIKFIGLDNYIDIFKDNWFIESSKNTFIFALITVPVGIVLSLVLAVLIDKFVYLKNFLKLSVFLPYISSTVAAAVVWSVILQPSFGPVNELLRSLGMQNPPKWFADVHFALPSVIAFSIWQQLGYMVLIFMSGLKGIPEELYESAEIDGASEIRKFFAITIPMISPTTFFLFVMQLIGSFKVFDVVSALTDGGPGTSTTVIAYYIYRSAFQYYEMGMASSSAWVMFICIFAITLFQLRYQKKWVSYN